MMRSRLRSSTSDTLLSRLLSPRTSRVTPSPTLLRSQLLPRLRLRVALLRPPPLRETISQTSHSRREPLPSLPLRTSTYLSTVLLPSPLITLQSQRSRVERLLLRLPQSQLLRPRRSLARSPLIRLLRRSSSTLPLSQLARRRLPRRVALQLRSLPLVARSRPLPCPHQAARSRPRPPTR